MATATWFEFGGVSTQKVFAVPKRASELKHWLKAVRKVIARVPELSVISTVEMTEDSIKVEWPEVGVLHIDRTTRKAI